MRNPWTDPIIAVARKLWAEGQSATQIAAALKECHGVTVTRNAVIGKLHRLGLCGGQVARNTAPRRMQRDRQEIQRRVMVAKLKVAKTSPPDPPKPAVDGGVQIGNLRWHHCRAIVSGTGADALFCGHARKPGSSYCAHHHARYTTGVVWSAPRSRIISEGAR